MAAQERMKTEEMGTFSCSNGMNQKRDNKRTQPGPLVRARGRLANVRLQDLTPF